MIISGGEIYDDEIMFDIDLNDHNKDYDSDYDGDIDECDTYQLFSFIAQERFSMTSVCY